MKKKHRKRKFKRFWATVYTDASFREGTGSWACWIRTGKGRIIDSGPCPKEIVTSNQAELYAAYKALDIIQRDLPKTVGIFLNADSLLVCEKILPNSSEIQGASKKWQKECHEIIKKNNWEIKTRHVKAHQKVNCSRTYINNQVDELAKKAMPEIRPKNIFQKFYGKMIRQWYLLKKRF